MKLTKIAHRRLASGSRSLLVNRVNPIPLPDRRPGSGNISDIRSGI